MFFFVPIYWLSCVLLMCQGAHAELLGDQATQLGDGLAGSAVVFVVLGVDRARQCGGQRVGVALLGGLVGRGQRRLQRLVVEQAAAVAGAVAAAAGFVDACCSAKSSIWMGSALSPQCGFASTEEGNELAENEQWAKLERIVKVAEEVWG